MTSTRRSMRYPISVAKSSMSVWKRFTPARTRSVCSSLCGPDIFVVSSSTDSLATSCSVRAVSPSSPSISPSEASSSSSMNFGLHRALPTEFSLLTTDAPNGLLSLFLPLCNPECLDKLGGSTPSLSLSLPLSVSESRLLPASAFAAAGENCGGLPKLRGKDRLRFTSADRTSSKEELRVTFADDERGAPAMDGALGEGVASSKRHNGGGEGGRYAGKTATDAGRTWLTLLREVLRVRVGLGPRLGLREEHEAIPFSGGVGGVDVQLGGGRGPAAPSTPSPSLSGSRTTSGICRSSQEGD